MVGSTKTALRVPENRIQSDVRDRYLVGSPLGPKDVPQQMNYQGYMVHYNDSSAVTDTFEMIFAIYDDLSVGTLLWGETQPEIPLINGLFNVLLGSVNTLPDTIFNGQELWLETTVEGETLSPRKKLVSVPYAFKDDCWTSSGTNCYLDKSGNVGIGTRTITNGYKMEVAGSVKLGDQATLWIPSLSSGQASKIHFTNSGDDHDAILVTLDGDMEINCWHGIILDAGKAGSGTNHITFNIRNSPKMYIKSDGNVGIGTTSPNSKLEVDGTIHSISSGFKFPDGTTQTTAAGSGAAYWTASGGDIYSTNSDNVGIGTTQPHAKLDVNGTIRLKPEGQGGSYAIKAKTMGVGSGTGWYDTGIPSWGALILSISPMYADDYDCYISVDKIAKAWGEGYGGYNYNYKFHISSLVSGGCDGGNPAVVILYLE